MDILVQVVLLAAGFLLLLKGADWFVDGASKLADKLGIPQLVIGLTIVAMGTSAPELAVSVSAALKESAEITIGNVVGSNIMNILLILGLTSIIKTVAVQKSTIQFDIPIVIGATVLLGVLGLPDNTVGFVDGLILIVVMAAYLFYLFRMTKSGQEQMEEVETAKPGDKVWKMLLAIVVGLGMIVFGSDVTVDAASELARIFGMSERLIGLTIVAFGTSLPELLTSVTAAVKGKADIAVGNIVGSNIFNILLIVGLSAVITPVTYSANFLVDTIVCVAAAVLLWICVIPKKKLNAVGGIIMLLSYAGYFIYLIQS